MKPIMEKLPRAWIFFIIFIVFTTFMVLNLLFGVVVNAETTPVLAEVGRLRDEALQAEIRSARGSRRTAAARTAGGTAKEPDSGTAGDSPRCSRKRRLS